jgi:U6 snRNA-associated Sm-like protein LSm5
VFCVHDSHISRLAQPQVNLVLEDATEFSLDPADSSKVLQKELKAEILLNGNQIAILVPGGTGPLDSMAAASS